MTAPPSSSPRTPAPNDAARRRRNDWQTLLTLVPYLWQHKARILTMAALGAGMGPQELKQWLAE